MPYKAVVTSYYAERKVPNAPNYENVKALEHILNHVVTPAAEKRALKGYQVKQVLATSTGERIVYTVIFHKEPKRAK